MAYASFRKRLKQSTVKYKFAVMKAFLKYCVEENYIGDNCCADYDNITIEKSSPYILREQNSLN